MSSVVLDASALLALLRNEHGADVVAEQVRGSIMSTVNLAEIMQRMLDFNVSSQVVLRHCL